MEIVDRVKEKIRTEVSEIENRTDLTKDEKVEKICIIFGTFCGALAAQPIPFADIFVLTPIQAYMGKKIADIHGYNITEQGSVTIFKEIAGLIGMGLLSQQLAIGAYKTFIPFFGAITTIPLVFGLTYGMGKVMNAYFKAKIKGEAISKVHIRDIFKNAKKEGQKMGKKNEQGIKKAAQDLPLPKDNDLTPNNTTLSDVDNSFAAVDGKFDAVDDQITKNINALRQRTADRNAAASEKTKLAILDKVTIPSSKPMLDPEYNKKTNVVNAVQDSNDTYDDSLLKDMGKDAVSQLVRERIRTAISAFNKRLSQRRAEKIREYNGQFIPAVVMDENALEQAMYKIAKDSENAAEFITQMRNSDVREVNIVMRFLKTGSGKNSEVHILTAYYYLYKSNANFLPLITEILEDANMKMVTDKVLVNAAKSQQIMKRLESQSKASSHEAVQNYAVTMEYIRTTPISEIDPQAFLQVLQYFGDSVVDYNRILEYGYLNVRGRPYGIATLITDMAMQAVKGKYIYAKSNRHGGRGTIVKFDVDKHGIYHTSGTIRDVYGCRPRVDDINRQPLNGKKYEGPYLPINKHYQGMVEAILETNSQLTNTQL